MPILFEAAVPKNSRAKDGAWKYLNAMLDPKAQVAFADKMGYVPTVKDAKLPDDLAKRDQPLRGAAGEAASARLRLHAARARRDPRLLEQGVQGVMRVVRASGRRPSAGSSA